MGVGCRAHSIDCDGNAAICAIFESNGEGTTTCKFAVKLGLCCARADGSPGNEVLGNVIGIHICGVRG